MHIKFDIYFFIIHVPHFKRSICFISIWNVESVTQFVTKLLSLTHDLPHSRWVCYYNDLSHSRWVCYYNDLSHSRWEYATIMIYHTRGEYATIMIYHTRGEYATIMIYHTRGEYTTIMIYHTRGEYATITSMLYLLLLLCIYLFLWFVQKFFF